MDNTHPRLQALMARASAQAGNSPDALGLVYPCDALALDAARRIQDSGMARPVLIGPAAVIAAAADAAQVDVRDFELIDSGSAAPDAALRACALARAISACSRGCVLSMLRPVVDAGRLRRSPCTCPKSAPA